MRERERYEKRVGTVVDSRWRIDGLLGWGSTSAVYEATHRNGHRAALKIIHQSLSGGADPAATSRFLREAALANAIKHRAIVPVRDDGTTEEGCAYLVLELLRGETLEGRRTRDGGTCLSLEELAPIFEELASAISAVHAAGIVHRDLKPHNVFLTENGELKLLDFGTARILDREPGSPQSLEGLVIGTPGFMSPEQAKGARDDVDVQSDVWSLGAVVFTMLSGEFVHPGKDAHARLLAAASLSARSLTSLDVAIDDRVAHVVDRALLPNKSDRWPDVQSMRIAFRTAVMTAVPTMRDLRVFASISADIDDQARLPGSTPDSAVRTTSPPNALALPARRVTTAPLDPFSLRPPFVGPTPDVSGSAVPVTATARTRGTNMPLSALLVGVAAMAGAMLVVGFFLAESGASPRLASGTAPDQPPFVTGAPASSAAPTPSFLVTDLRSDVLLDGSTSDASSGAVAPRSDSHSVGASGSARTSGLGVPFSSILPEGQPIVLDQDAGNSR